MDYTDNVSPAPLLGWWAPRLAPVPSPAHTPVRRAPAAPPWAPGWIKKLLWIMSAKMSTCSCSFLLGRRSCSSSLVGFVLLCMGFCDNNNINGLSRRWALFSNFRIRKSCARRQWWLFTCCGPCHHVLPYRHCSSRPSRGFHKVGFHQAPCKRRWHHVGPEKWICQFLKTNLAQFPLTSISMKAKPGGFLATQTSRTRPILEKASSRSNLSGAQG